jgi:hypothetical protein
MTAEELHRKIYEKGVIAAWSRIVVEKFQAKIKKLDIGKTNGLAQSFKHTSNAQKVTFSFNEYGKFVDMGVGKGVSIGGAKESKSVHARALGTKNRRKPKKWYSPTLRGQIIRLTEILASEYGRGAADMIKQNLSVPLVIEM